VPPETFKDGWAFELDRDNLDREVVCQVHCDGVGSNMRLLNHDYKAVCARFVVRKIPEKYRVVVEATRNIHDNEKITVHYYGGEHVCSSLLAPT
jgi:SET domain